MFHYCFVVPSGNHVYLCWCKSLGATYRARNRFPEAHAELMTEDVQQEAFTSLQKEEERELIASYTSWRRLRQCGGYTDPLVVRIQGLLSKVFLAVITVIYLRASETPAKCAEKVTPVKTGKCGVVYLDRR